MGGIHNEIVYGENVDFTGSSPPVGQMDADGKLLIGSAVYPYIRAALLTSGDGTIGFTFGNGTIDMFVQGGGFTWNVVTSADNPVSLVSQNGYISKGAGVVDFVLPVTAAVGDMFKIVGYGNLWTIAQNAFQSITMGVETSTIGIGGSVSASQVRDTIEIVCVTANTEFQIVSSIGNLIIV